MAVPVLIPEPGVNRSLGVGYVSESKKGLPEDERGWAGVEKVVCGLSVSTSYRNSEDVHHCLFVPPQPESLGVPSWEKMLVPFDEATNRKRRGIWMSWFKGTILVTWDPTISEGINSSSVPGRPK
ncbi:hypothetical protein MRB53_016371 [Persea americana]|uniref:Uncharacterized protein n=1 Tax=Persea americana TaxID=3435 RepID=A0ACC2M3B5_PERAE|nr:hypothetical protein MRB53_016371 [Persea americana]